MKLRILYHGNCFDGVSSAAIFSKFYRTKINSDVEIAYTPVMHRAGNAFDRDQLDGDVNAIVDFKYSTGGSTIIKARFSRRRTKRISNRKTRRRSFLIQLQLLAPNLSPALLMKNMVLLTKA
jgi:hypothetical protein